MIFMLSKLMDYYIILYFKGNLKDEIDQIFKINYI